MTQRILYAGDFTLSVNHSDCILGDVTSLSSCGIHKYTSQRVRVVLVQSNRSVMTGLKREIRLSELCFLVTHYRYFADVA